MDQRCPHCNASTRLGARFCRACGGSLVAGAQHYRSRTWIIGADVTCDLQVPAGTVSGRHCRLTQEQGIWWVEDLGSLNGTFLHDQQIKQRLQVAFGSPISLGHKIPMPWPVISTEPNPVRVSFQTVKAGPGN